MPDADKEDAIVVAVTRDGAVFLGQNKVDPSQLGSLVRDKLADKTDKTIYVRADARAQYKAVEDAIDDVRTAGVEEVGLLTQKARRQSRSAASNAAQPDCSVQRY